MGVGYRRAIIATTCAVSRVIRTGDRKISLPSVLLPLLSSARGIFGLCAADGVVRGREWLLLPFFAKGLSILIESCSLRNTWVIL